MKAARFEQTGGPDVLKYVDVAKPEPTVNQILIKTESISVNFADTMMRRGVYPMMPPLPVVPGLEACGTVEATGQGVQSPKPGMKVVALGFGSYGEYMVADAPLVFVLPANIDPDQAAAIPVNYLTAFHMMHTMAHIHAGQTIVVYAAAGGVGTAVIQLGKLVDATVIGLTSNPQKEKFAQDQGATHVVNYKEEQVSRRVLDITRGRGADLILNPVAGGTFHEDFAMLAPLGQIIWFGMAGGPPRADLLGELAQGFGRGVGIRTFHLINSLAVPFPELMRKSMERMIELLMEKKIKPVIFERIPLAEADRAHELLENGKVMGKLILKP